MHPLFSVPLQRASCMELRPDANQTSLYRAIRSQSMVLRYRIALLETGITQTCHGESSESKKSRDFALRMSLGTAYGESESRTLQDTFLPDDRLEDSSKANANDEAYDANKLFNERCRTSDRF